LFLVIKPDSRNAFDVSGVLQKNLAAIGSFGTPSTTALWQLQGSGGTVACRRGEFECMIRKAAMQFPKICVTRGHGDAKRIFACPNHTSKSDLNLAGGSDT